MHEVSRRVWGLRLRRTKQEPRAIAPVHVAFRTLQGRRRPDCQFTELNTHPAYPLSTLRCVPRDTQRKTRGRADRYSFLVRNFHPLLHAGLARRTVTILTTPELDFSKGSIAPLPFESAAQLVQAFDEGAAKVRAALQATPDEAWKENWKLSFQGKTIFEGQRFLAYREMFLNHLVHHRAQLGVYLRLNGKPVPAIYGPSADDTMGF